MPAGAPVGNQNAVKSKPWADAIRYALAERERTNKPGALRDLASTMIDKALEGDMVALKELGDRLDGKPAQAVDATVAGPNGGPVQSQVTVGFIGAAPGGVSLPVGEQS